MTIPGGHSHGAVVVEVSDYFYNPPPPPVRDDYNDREVMDRNTTRDYLFLLLLLL